MPPADEVAARLAAVHARIAAAAQRAGRAAQDVRLVAVTKGVEPDRIALAIAAGVTELGENRVQEAARKQPEVPPRVGWHMLGHVQRNKAARVASLFDHVHSLDGEQLMDLIAERRGADRAALSGFIEVELTGIEGRSGVAEDDVARLVRHSAGLARIEVVGLMTMAPPARDPEAARPFFRRLRELRDRVRVESGRPLPELSMGMSDDFEVAIEEGATVVRIGRAIFGERG